MKSFRLIRVLLLVPILFLFIRCSFTSDLNKIQSSLENTKLIFGTPKFKNVIHFEFVDTKTNLPVTGSIKLKVSGPGVSKVYSNIGEQKSEYTATDGMLDLALDPHIDSSYLERNPVRFDVTSQISGYLDETRQIEVSHGRIKYIPVSLINLNDGNTAGVKVSVQSLKPSYDADNKTINPTIQQIDGTNTTIEILQGTVLKDASGNPLTGTVNSQVVFFSAADNDTQNIIQDDLTGEVQLKDGSTTQTRLISAGMFSIGLTVGDKTVKTMDGNGLKISTIIPSYLFNPVKNRAIQEGDTIPLWSRDDGSSKWIFEKNTVVKRDAIGFYLEDIVSHLCNWNWDWEEHSDNYCVTGPRINWKLHNFDGTEITEYENLNSEFTINKTHQTPGWIYDKYYFQLNYTPRNIRGSMSFAEKYPVLGRTLEFSPASISFTDLCSLPEQTIVVTADYGHTSILFVNLNLFAKSTDASNKIIIRPNQIFYYKPYNEFYWYQMILSNGFASIVLATSLDYDVKGTFGDNSVYGKLRIDNVGINQVQVKLTPIINESKNGSLISLDPLTIPLNNTIEVDYTAILSPDIYNALKH